MVEVLLGSQALNKSEMNYIRYLDNSVVMSLSLIKTLY